MNKATWFVLVGAAVIGGYAIGRSTKKSGVPGEEHPAAVAAAGKAGPAAPRPPGAAAALPNEIYKIEVGGAPAKGGKQPKVTIIEFSDFQCPFCSRVVDTIKKIGGTYGNDVQIAFKHLPLPFHNNAMAAAEAAEAAHAQGKFWEMHDKLFANQQSLDRASLDKYAGEIGLDMAKFKADLDGGKHKPAVDTDKTYGGRFGATGTPSFFVNGRKFVGAQPFESFKAVIDSEIARANEAMKGGAPRDRLYAELTKNGLDKAVAPAPRRPQGGGEAEAGVAYRADIAGAPVKGARDALVTIVQFSDFQCPFCSRVEPTMDRIMTEYKGKVRVAWRDFPLPFHDKAKPAALAARAAGEQGKFWEMHAKIFTNQQSLDRATFEKHAQEIGLNMGKFKAALDQEKGKGGMEADAAMGSKVGVRGTPAFFVNGTFLSGAQPFEAFKERIDGELKKAETLVAAGTPKNKLYEAIMKNAKSELAAAAPAAQPGGAEPAGPENDQAVSKIEIGNSPAKGPKGAPITMVVFSDFQCPFCSRVEPTLKQLEKEYPGKIRIVWKNYPLEFHQNAKPAAQAAMAAGEQGKFWEMHDKLFENQTSLERASLDKYAQELGLDMAKFKAAMDGNKHSAQIEAETKQGLSIGVQGTPATFINGRRIPGAYPYETFKKILDQELAKPRKGT